MVMSAMSIVDAAGAGASFNLRAAHPPAFSYHKNIPSPRKILRTYVCDALRFWIALELSR